MRSNWLCLILVVLLVLVAGNAFAVEVKLVGSTESIVMDYGDTSDVDVDDSADAKYVTLPAPHDATGRSESDWSAREKHFLATVPEVDGNGRRLRAAVREMLLASPPVVHPTDSKCGNYVPGTSAHYWEIYQAWTGPHKVRVKEGKRGPRGLQGPQGDQGPKGDQGSPGQGNVTNIWNVNPAQAAAATPTAYVVPGQTIVYQLGSVGFIQTSPTNICIGMRQSVGVIVDVDQGQWLTNGGKK